jgi:hypothetical protein
MAEKGSINIRREHDGQITFTPDVPGAGKGQPLGVNAGDNVTWNNHTDQEIILKTIYPKDKDVFLCDPIPAGDVRNPQFDVTVSNPQFHVTETVGYYWVRQHAPQPIQPDAWILVVP